ncbi:MAG: ROK family protein [Bryobacteraceae bacterium]
MAHGIGISITDRIAAASIVDHAVEGTLIFEREREDGSDALRGTPAELIAEKVANLVKRLGLKSTPTHVGLAVAGIVRNGYVEDSPNLAQFKGVHVQQLITDALTPLFGRLPVLVMNDADAMAAGMAASRGHLDRLVRLWYLGTGVGYGRYPLHDGVWENGHSVVSLDPKERYCGCGGSGHLEGIMGFRSMRLRFMDLEPDEVFDQAQAGEARCVEFVKLWHRALAAGTASSVHVSGAGKFFITGAGARYVNLSLLSEYMQEMVKLSPLQGYSFEIVPGGEEIATIGAAVSSAQAAKIS